MPPSTSSIGSQAAAVLVNGDRLRVAELMRELEFPSKSRGLVLTAVMVIENLQCHIVIAGQRPDARDTPSRIHPARASRRRRSRRTHRRAEARIQPRSGVQVAFLTT